MHNGGCIKGMKAPNFSVSQEESVIETACVSSPSPPSAPLGNLSQYRYIKPRCAPLGTKGSFCISSQTEPSKFGLPFPDYYLVVEAGYNQFCPCQPGLVCYRGECHPEDEVTTHSR
ncbi:uncharacterized protein LOC135111572 [Scylla paramamosain]|uniref:Astakine n=1 Tax=Scylla paramamosain TaxID=85552 RepID=S6DEP9_SCYPA|nr:astakine [Scylla paramamosain]